jgi:16S rRNA (uracil1498-N3)-methyltransferase
MPLPFFFEENIPGSGKFMLSEESSRHIVQVLRMREGEEILITNGKGEVLTAIIILEDKKKTEVKITGRKFNARQNQKVSIAISLIKNNTRFEWFLEKATEIGVSEIIPLICQRTEKQHFKYDRLKNIIVSAMLQSQQGWLPALHEPVKFTEVINNWAHQNKYIAHCMEGSKNQLSHEAIQQGDILLLIGPEGDFTKDEIESALKNNYVPVNLGETRLRTETAGVVAAVMLLNMK